jgi:FkbM family methyltransferase
MTPEIKAQGALFRTRPGCRIGQALKKHGVYEPSETRLIAALLRPGDIFVDVGAHIGYHAVLACRLVGDKGLVIAFEPDPISYSFLVQNLEQNACRTALFYDIAILDQVGRVKLYLNDQNTADNRCYDAGDGRRAIEVQAMTLDGILNGLLTNRALHPRMVKIDTQGSEVEVLRGARKLLEKGPELLIEWWPKGLIGAGHQPSQLLDELEGAGYSLFWPGGGPVDKPSLLRQAAANPLPHANIYGRKTG